MLLKILRCGVHFDPPRRLPFSKKSKVGRVNETSANIISELTSWNRHWIHIRYEYHWNIYEVLENHNCKRTMLCMLYIYKTFYILFKVCAYLVHSLSLKNVHSLYMMEYHLFSGYIYIFGVYLEVKIKLTPTHFKFRIEVNMFNVFKVELDLWASYGSLRTLDVGVSEYQSK